MAHSPDFLAGLQEAAQTCNEQAQKSGGVAEGAMSDDPATLSREAMAAGAHNCAASIREFMESPTSTLNASLEEPERLQGLRQGASVCDQVVAQYQIMADSKFVTAYGKSLHLAMAQGAVAAGDAVRALLASLKSGAPHAVG